LAVLALTTATLVILGTGCDAFKTGESRFLAAHHVISQPEDGPSTMGIIDSATALDQTEHRVPNSTFPTPRDLIYSDADYVIGAGDVIAVSILDLYYEGAETSVQRTVSESGYIDLPLLTSRIRAAGRTKERLKRAIIDAYVKERILRRERANVSVELLVRRKSVFSILGAVSRPGAYQVTRPDMRLMEALAIAGDVSQANLKWIYVIRQPRPVPSNGRADQPPRDDQDTEEDADDQGEQGDGFDRLRGGLDESPAVLSLSAQDATSPTAETDPDQLDDQTGWTRIREKLGDNGDADDDQGPAVTVEDEPQGQTGLPIEPDEDAPFGYPGGTGEGSGARVLAINLEKLQQGDPMMNVVIRDNDVIQVPTLEVGEFYITGEVNRPGVYSITGRQVTLKQGIAAAGGFNAIAWPENTILIRRINDTQEQFIPIDLEAIYKGREQDYYLKANDILAVGTNWRASFMAVFRNAFRMTYGFGFIYDRNFAEPLDFGGDLHDSSRFKRW
jgi:protein involved in polysaccharide export with SLBB domain